LAIAILRIECAIGTPETARNAKNILKELCLSCFIPAEGRGEKTGHPFLRFCDTRPVYFVTAVRLYGFIINKFRGDHPEERKYIHEAFHFIFNESIPGQLLERIIKEDRVSSNKIALGLISHEVATEYEALKSHFFDLKKTYLIQKSLVT
jgi:hypothetical protein